MGGRGFVAFWDVEGEAGGVGGSGFLVRGDKAGEVGQ